MKLATSEPEDKSTDIFDLLSFPLSMDTLI